MFELTDEKGIGRSFPCEISFPMATPAQLHSITHISVTILQIVWFLVPTGDKVHPQLLAKDVYPVTVLAQVRPSIDPQPAQLPLPDPAIHGRYSSEHLRVRHALKLSFHRRWGRKFEWEEEVEIFHRDLGWELKGVKGILEVVRGEEGDDWTVGEEEMLSDEMQS
jgi:hypothetical protein